MQPRINLPLTAVFCLLAVLGETNCLCSDKHIDFACGVRAWVPVTKRPSAGVYVRQLREQARAHAWNVCIFQE